MLPACILRLFISALTAPHAQELAPEVVARARAIAAIAATDHAPPPATVDVLHYALHLDVIPPERRLRGRAELELRPAGATRREIQLDADELSIKSVADAAGAALPFQHRGRRLEIDLGRDVAPDESLRLAIEYEATPRRGLVFVPGADGSCTMVWTQGQCEMASAWFPCRDDPADRASSELFVTLPEPWRSVSNGVLIEAKPAGEGRRTDHWRMDFPHPPYLTSLAAGPFVELDLGRVRDLPLLAYATAERKDAATITLQPTGAMIELLEKLSGLPYPYPAYRQVCVEGFPWGGMENVAASTLAATELVEPARPAEGRDDAEALVVHEIAHQWFGNLVTCATWADLWLNEGFATYAEVAWLEASGEPGAADAAWLRIQETAVAHRIDEPRPIVSSRCVHPDELFDATVYEAAGAFLNLLRHVVGPAKFEAGVKAWIARHPGRSVGTAEFEATFEEVAGPGLADLFQEWLHARGQPEIDFSWSFDAASRRLELSAQQKQGGEGVPAVYHVPIDVAWHAGGTRRVTRMQLDARRCRLAVECDEAPRYVRFNAGGALFGVLESVQEPAAWREQLALEVDPLGRIEAARALAAAWQGFAADADAERRLTLAALARALIEDGVVAVRTAAAAALGEVGGDVARTALGCALWDDDPRVREAAAEGLGAMKDDVAAGLLVRRFGTEPTHDVRAALIHALSEYGGSQALPTLTTLIDDERGPPRLRGAALLAVAQTEALPPEGLSMAVDRATKHVAAGSPRELKLAAIAALGELATRSDAACDLLLRQLEEASVVTVAAALEALELEELPLRALPALVAFHERAAFADHRGLARELVARLVLRLPH